MLTAKSFLGLSIPLSLVGYFLIESFVTTPRYLSRPVWLAAFGGLVVISILVLMNKAESEEERAIEGYRK